MDPLCDQVLEPLASDTVRLGSSNIIAYYSIHPPGYVP